MATSVMHVCRPGGSDMASFVGKGSAVVPVWHFSSFSCFPTSSRYSLLLSHIPFLVLGEACPLVWA